MNWMNSSVQVPFHNDTEDFQYLVHTPLTFRVTWGTNLCFWIPHLNLLIMVSGKSGSWKGTFPFYILFLEWFYIYVA
jgi:hypothetical protein